MNDFVKRLRDLMGTPSTDPAVEEFLNQFGIKARPKLEKGDYRAYLPEPSKGFSVIFTNGPHLGNPKFKKIKKGVLILTGCHFYSEGWQKYKQFAGALPCELDFKDTRKKVVKKLGDASWQSVEGDIVERERWENGDRQLNVTYLEKEAGIAIVYFGIREFFAKDVEVEL